MKTETSSAGNVSVSTTSSFAIFARTRNAASLSGYLTIARKSHGFARRARDQPPQSGPPTGVLSVTITGPDLATADAYASQRSLLAREPLNGRDVDGYEAMTILADGRVR